MENSIIGVHHTYSDAVDAVKKLVDNGLSAKEISILGKASDIENHIHLNNSSSSKVAPIAIGAGIGSLTGLLVGVGVFAVPGLGFLYGAGAIVGAIAGLDFGLIGGGVAKIIETIAKDEHTHTLKEYIESNHYLVAYSGKEKEKAIDLLKSTTAEDVFA